jgi:hypothetical protein
MARRVLERVVRGEWIREPRSAGSSRRCVATWSRSRRNRSPNDRRARFQAGAALQAIERVVADDHAVGADAVDHARDAIGFVVAIRPVDEQPRLGAVDPQRVEASRIGVVARRGHDAARARP